MTDPPAPPPPPDEHDQVSRDFDDVARITAAVTRGAIAAAVAAPAWLLLLWLFGETLGVGLASFLLATASAALLGWWWLRRFGPSRAEAARNRTRAAGAGMGIPRVAIVVAVVILFAYLLLVVRATS